MDEYIPYNNITILISAEEVQNISKMDEHTAKLHLEEYYGINASRILKGTFDLVNKSNLLTLKIKQI